MERESSAETGIRWALAFEQALSRQRRIERMHRVRNYERRTGLSSPRELFVRRCGFGRRETVLVIHL